MRFTEPLAIQLVVLTLGLNPTLGEEIRPVTLENYQSPGANLANEPIAKEFSLENAKRFLDNASLDWQATHGCFTCHTNFSYLMARGRIGSSDPALKTVRAFAEELVTKRWKEQGPRWDAEVVATAAALAMDDAATTGKLHETTKLALDRIWQVQKENGGFDWLKCAWPPMESDDEYGAILAAIAVGSAPEKYSHSEIAQAGLKKLKAYLQSTPMPTLHHRAMMVWAGAKIPGLCDPNEKQEVIDDLKQLQQDDGGWAAASLGGEIWKRSDNSPQDFRTSDGYGTAFVIFVLRQSGVSVDDPAIVRGIHWLKTQQRESGRWFTRSLREDGPHYLTHAGTAFAVLALSECDALPKER